MVNATFALGAAALIVGVGALALFAGGFSTATDFILFAPGGVLLSHAVGWYAGELIMSRALSIQLGSATPQFWPAALIHGGIGWGTFAAILVFA